MVWLALGAQPPNLVRRAANCILGSPPNLCPMKRDESDMPGRRTSILFVCLGNICRSPLAEAIFRHQADGAGRKGDFLADSAGTASYHIGKPADPRSRAIAMKHGVRLAGRARSVTDRDFAEFDIIVAMDRSNLDWLKRSRPPGASARLVLMRDYDNQDPGADVPDPYYGGSRGFERVYDMLDRSCRVLIAKLGDGDKP